VEGGEDFPSAEDPPGSTVKKSGECPKGAPARSWN